MTMAWYGIHHAHYNRILDMLNDLILANVIIIERSNLILINGDLIFDDGSKSEVNSIFLIISLCNEWRTIRNYHYYNYLQA